jgi:carbon storage regulator
MIVFRRKKHDQIVINGDIVVTIMNIRGSRVSLGIEAPSGVRILRHELEPRKASPTLPIIETEPSKTSPLTIR